MKITARPVLGSFLAPLVAVSSGQTSPASPTVTIKNGTLIGRNLPTFQQDVFLNIPYAQSTGGQNRLRMPQPINESWSEPRDATNWGPSCPGVGVTDSADSVAIGFNTTNSEDCLAINIVRPQNTSSDAELPVLVWIHGGGFTQGTAVDPRWNASYMVQRSVEIGKPIMYASINYRLSAWGFPASEEIQKEGLLNLGFYDQRQALHWVQENIAAFGGSPSKVTIFGLSAGGISVAAQVAGYGGRNDNLFRAAIINSGILSISNATVESQSTTWQNFISFTGCTNSSQQVQCLRDLPYEAFFEATVNSTYGPREIPDGNLFQKTPILSFKNWEWVDVPILTGNVRDEATYAGFHVPLGLQNETALRMAVNKTFIAAQLSNSTITQLLDYYPQIPSEGCPFNSGDGVLSSGLMDKRMLAIWTDQTHAGTRYLCTQTSTNSSRQSSIWSYRFNQIPQNETIDLGVSHTQEIPYVFRVLERTTTQPLGNRPGDLSTSLAMQTYYINFVHDLNPNGQDALYWPTYDASKPKNMVFLNDKIHIENDTYREKGIGYLTEIVTQGS